MTLKNKHLGILVSVIFWIFNAAREKHFDGFPWGKSVLRDDFSFNENGLGICI